AGPLELSVDPACRSREEADALCAMHRARMTEGFCVLCGRREPWVSPWPSSEIGACERCYRVVFGDPQADAEHHPVAAFAGSDFERCYRVVFGDPRTPPGS